MPRESNPSSVWPPLRTYTLPSASTAMPPTFSPVSGSQFSVDPLASVCRIVASSSARLPNRKYNPLSRAANFLTAAFAGGGGTWKDPPAGQTRRQRQPAHYPHAASSFPSLSRPPGDGKIKGSHEPGEASLLRSMKPTAILAVAGLLISMAGCSLRGTPKTVATPPPPKPVSVVKPQPPPPEIPSEPLSVPQTRVSLPSPQAIDPAALAVSPEPAPVPRPARTRTRSLRSPSPMVGPVPPPAAAAAQSPAPDSTAAQTPTPSDERPRIQPIVPAEEVHRIQETIEARKREVNERLAQARRRQLSGAEQNVVSRVRSFLNLSDEAARRGDMTQADALSERAVVLARELQVAK